MRRPHAGSQAHSRATRGSQIFEQPLVDGLPGVPVANLNGTVEQVPEPYINPMLAKGGCKMHVACERATRIWASLEIVAARRRTLTIGGASRGTPNTHKRRGTAASRALKCKVARYINRRGVTTLQVGHDVGW